MIDYIRYCRPRLDTQNLLHLTVRRRHRSDHDLIMKQMKAKLQNVKKRKKKQSKFNLEKYPKHN